MCCFREGQLRNSLTLEITGDGIWMSYNVTLSVLNAVLWDPHFALLPVHSTLSSVQCVTIITDIDIWVDVPQLYYL